MYTPTVTRRWRAFDAETINKEMRDLPQEDYFRLSQAMLAYRMDTGSGYVVKNYGEGLMMVRDGSHGAGRCLFFSVREEQGVEVLVALLVYKKESQEAPKRVIDTARQRMK